jgi:hypothetical protein
MNRTEGHETVTRHGTKGVRGDEEYYLGYSRVIYTTYENEQLEKILLAFSIKSVL